MHQWVSPFILCDNGLSDDDDDDNARVTTPSTADSECSFLLLVLSIPTTSMTTIDIIATRIIYDADDDARATTPSTVDCV